jgi:hypothetical protein
LWSPNGDRIATVWRTGSTDAAGNWLQQSADLWVVDSASGSTMTNVASVEGEGDLEPIAFSPDGERILVRRDDGLSSVAIDGSGSTVLVPGADHGAWVPANARR